MYIIEKVEKKEEKSNQRHQEPRSESPVNSLEDLFRKTKTIPYIYWLPLNDEQALEREKYRNQLEKEREARIAQRMEMSARKSSPPLHSAPMSRDMVNIFSLLIQLYQVVFFLFPESYSKNFSHKFSP